MASLLTPEFVAAAGLPADPAEPGWPRSPTGTSARPQIYTEMVAAGKLPPRPGIRRIISDAQDAGWKLAVASTSAEPSVRAILDYAAGPERAARFDLFLAGDVVAAQEAGAGHLPAGARAARRPAADVLVIEDSRNGLVAAAARRPALPR